MSKPSNKQPRHDFAALRRKLSVGRTLAEAAEEAGMPLEVAREYLGGLRTSEAEDGDEKLLLWSNKALNKAYRALSQAIIDQNRHVADGSTGAGGGYTKEAVIDIPAAQALLKAALEARKIVDKRREVAARTGASKKLPPGGGGGLDQPDLFDNPWTFKKSDP